MLTLNANTQIEPIQQTTMIRILKWPGPGSNLINFDRDRDFSSIWTLNLAESNISAEVIHAMFKMSICLTLTLSTITAAHC